MKNSKRTALRAAAVIAAASLTLNVSSAAFADNDMIIEIVPETGDTHVDIYPDKERTEISPYIFGINDDSGMDGLLPSVIRQRGSSLSAYNWENNFTNSGINGRFTNDVSLVEGRSSRMWSDPALLTDGLVRRAEDMGIPVRLVTLQMMGYVAADSMGVVTDDMISRNTRWKKVANTKSQPLLMQPDLADDTVYMDEYVSFLINKYGSAEYGGINGYFLDNEPDKWAENYSVLGLEQLSPTELINKSAELANTVKITDSNAFVFGPSLSGLQACVDLNDPDGWSFTDSGGDYSWFIDSYLSGMRRASEKAGVRLLDVLDVHYYTEAATPVGERVLESDSQYSNAYRMQAVKTLWDSDYTENSPSVLMNKQFTPVIPTLQASIRINYPGTRLSFSEYDFGGGSNMSGAVAQADVLGVFAENNVYLACLSPTSEDYSFQKAAFRMFTDYDSQGSGFGDRLIKSDNGGDAMSGVYAASDKDDPSVLRILLTNRNMVNEKNFTLSIESEEYTYELDSAYTIDKENADIISVDTESIHVEEGGFVSFTADTTSVYMLVLYGTPAEEEITSWTSSSEDESGIVSGTDNAESITENTSETTHSETETATETVSLSDTASETTALQTESATEAAADESIETVVCESSASEETEITTEDTEQSVSETEPAEEEGRSAGIAVKITVGVLVAAVAAGVVYILAADKINVKK